MYTKDCVCVCIKYAYVEVNIGTNMVNECMHDNIYLMTGEYPIETMFTYV